MIFAWSEAADLKSTMKYNEAAMHSINADNKCGR